MPTAATVLARNDNATQVSEANAWLGAQFQNQSSDWWRMTFGPSGWAGPPLENSYNIFVFAMFNSKSPAVVAGEVAALSASAEEGMQKFWLNFVQHCATYYAGEATGDVLRLHDSENIDTVRHTGCYYGAKTLARFSAYAKVVLPDSTTVEEAAALAYSVPTYPRGASTVDRTSGTSKSSYVPILQLERACVALGFNTPSSKTIN